MNVYPLAPRLLAGASFCLLLACAPELKEPTSDTPYYDVAGVFEEKITELVAQRPSLQKHMVLDGEEERLTMTLDSAKDWENELRFFRDLDLNQPILFGAYQKTEETRDSLTAIVYTPDPPRKTGVQRLEVVLEPEGQLWRIEGTYRDQNSLYQMRRRVRAEFTPTAEGSRLDSYRVEGHQKMILKDSVAFMVEVQVEY